MSGVLESCTDEKPWALPMNLRAKPRIRSLSFFVGFEGLGVNQDEDVPSACGLRRKYAVFPL
jgi:hypothetical protein